MKSRSVLVVGAMVCAYAFQQSDQPRSPLSSPLLDPFATGWMVVDTSGDGIADQIAGKVVVPNNPTAAENAAAANIAGRIGYTTTGFTPPVVVTRAQDTTTGPRIVVEAGQPDGMPALQAGEGGVFRVADGLRVAGDADGLAAAAEGFAARAP